MPKTKKKKSKKAQKTATGAKKSARSSKDATKTKQADTGQRRGTRAKRPSGLDAAAKVLAEAGKPMSCKAIVEKILAQKLWQTKGKTPVATISAAIIREIANKGEKSRFRKAAPGKFTLAS